MTHLDRLKGATALVDGGFSRIQPMCLEPRFMFDAAGAATGAEAAQDAQAQAEAAAADPSGHNGTGDGNTSDASSGGGGSYASPAASSTGDTGGSDAATVTPDAIPANNDQQIHEVALIDTTIEGYEKLAAGFSSDVTVITFQSDGSLSQIADLLSSYSQLDAVHLVSHGSIGAINLGGTVIGVNDLSAQSDALAEIGTHLTETGDILLYGCDVGSDQRGMAFVDAMASLTGADVAASNDATGAVDQGGDWDLEVSSGGIETAVSLSETARNGFDALLASSETYDGIDSAGFGIDPGITTVDIGDWTYTSSVTTNFVVGEGSSYTTPSTLNTDGPGTDKVLEINGPYTSQNTNALTLTVQAKDGSHFTLTSFDFGIFYSTDADREATITVYNGATSLGTFSFKLATSSSGDGISYVANTDADSDFSTGNFSFDGRYANATSFSIAMAGPGTFQMDNLVATAAPTNSAPVATTSGGTTSYTENGSGTVIDSGFTVTDSDSATFASATISVTGNFSSGQDVLAYTNSGSQGNITGSYNSSTGVLTLTSSGSTATAAEWQSAIRSVTYANSSDAPSEAARTISITVNDGTDDSNTATKTVSVTAVNDDPTSQSSTDSNETGFPFGLTFTEDTQASLDLTSINLVDVDSGSGDLTLVLTASSGVFYLSASGVLELSGHTTNTITLKGTLSDLEAYINQPTNITYKPGENINGSGEKITVTLNDGGNTGTGGGSTVTLGDINLTITAVDDAPTASAPTDVTVFTDTLSNLDLSALDFADVDSTSLTVTLTLNAGTFSSPADGSGVGSGVTAALVNATTITLAGSITDINAYLGTSSNIKYTTASGAQGDNVAAITVKANDGTTDATVATINIDAEDPNDAPVLTPASPILTGINEDATTNSGQTVGSFLTGVTDADTGAVTGIAISGLTSGNGSWQYSTDAGSNWTNVGAVSETGALLLRSTDLVRFVPNGENATAASISYHAWDQTGSGSAGSKVSVTSTGADTAFSTATDTASITVTAVNDAPTVAGVPATVTVTEDSASDLDLSAIAFSDVDNGATLTVTFTAGAGTLAASDGTGVTVGGTSTALTLTGTVSAINTYLDTVGAIKYTSATNAEGTAVTTIGVKANDGAGSGDVDLGNMSVNVTGVNDAPTASGVPATVTVTEDSASNLDLSAITFTDVDSGATLTVTFTAGAGTLAASDGTGVTVGGTSTALTLTGTVSAINTYLDTVGAIKYTSAADATGTGVTTIGVKANDGAGSGDVDFGNMSVNVTNVNDAPTVTGVPATVTVTEDTASNLDLSAITFADVDSSGNITVTFTAGAGTLAASDGTDVTVGGTGTATLTLTGTVSAINTYLDTVGAIKYTSATNAEGTAVTTIGVKANDGAGSGDVNLGSMSVTVTGVNDAPTVTDNAVVTLTGANEDTTTSAVSISDILTSAGYGDVDTGASSGIAITGLTGNGTWQYSTDGTTWTTIGSASTTEAVLLTSTTQLHFVPDGNNGETATLSFKAWDQTSGTASTNGSLQTADVSTTGGNSAFSVNTASAKVVVTNVNDAPTVTGVPATVTVTEDTASNLDLSAITFADVDSSGDITVTFSAGAGTLAASDGTGVTVGGTGTATLTLTGTVSAINTYLDASGAVKYTSAANASGTAVTTIGVQANDSDGSGNVNLGSMSVTVTGVNDAPTVTDNAVVTLTGTNEDTTSSGVSISDILTSAGYADADTGASSGIAITGLTGNGTWQYSLNGIDWTTISAASPAAAVLLSSTTQVHFVPNDQNGETATLSFKAWDTTSGTASTNGIINSGDTTTSAGTSAFSSEDASIKIVVSDVNDAPDLTNGATVQLTGTSEATTSSGTAVSVILAGAGYSDVDTSATSGIAITGMTGNGTWQYSTDGTSWVDITSAAGNAAVLLTSSSQVRYIPDGNNGETATLSFKAWDQSSGSASTNGGVNTADTTTSGGTSAFSTNTASASLTVTDLNDAPTLTNGGVVTLPTTNEDTTSSGTAVSTILTSAGYADADAGANSGIAITGLTGNGTWQYSTDGTTWVTIGPASTTSALLLNSSSQVRFVPDGKNGETASLSFKAWDQTTGVASTSGIRNTADTTTSGGTAAFSNEVASASIVVSDVNDAPTGPGGLPGVTVENGGPLNYSLSVAGFADVDGDNLTFTATLADGSALPQWLNYSVNGTNVTFSGTVPGDFIGNIALRITATEDASAHLTATSDLTINVQPRPTVVPPAPPSAPDPAPVPPVMAPPGNGSLGDAGTPVSSAIDFGGRNNGDIAQPVTGQLGSLSPIDTSPTPVMAGFESATPPSIFGNSGGQTIFGGDVGGGTGILAARSQLITSQGSGVGGQGPVNGATGNGPDGSGGNDLPSGNEDINGGGGPNAAPAGNVPAEQAPEQAPEQGEQDGSAEPSSDNSPSAASPDGAPDNSSGNENGDVPPSDAGNVQGSLMVPGMSPFDTAANMDFTDQLAGAGNAFDRHASLLSKALSHYDASAA
ncbi:DUF4347 domain-containing protein [Thalassospira sp. NFXS8]|uniref:DUF4347 domain-containing protein n=1 Tax=Thalassospira sp. NFXS8 TaxID=2819093 RepID=UPI0032DF8C64